MPVSARLFRSRQRVLLILVLSVLTLTYWLVNNRQVKSLEESHRIQPELEPPQQLQHSHTSHHRVKTAVKLTEEQELAAVSNFIASLPQNVIPSYVDPNAQIDPELVLDFDVYGPRANEELKKLVTEVWSRNPIFLYCKLYSPVCREIKAILDTLRLQPPPTIIDVDVRDDAPVLRPLLERLTYTADFPILLIAGRTIGSIKDIRSLHKSGQLQQQITKAGAVINGAKRKKRKH